MKILLVIFIIFILICIVSWIVDTHRFVTRYYTISDSKIKKTVRFCMLSDLHNTVYGNDNDILLKAIDDAKPDMILIAGDMCNGIKGHDFTPAVNLLKHLYLKYPVYYGMGNHEYRLRRYEKQYGSMWNDYVAALAENNVHIMDNERVYLSDLNMDIASVTIDRRFYARFRGERLTESDVEEYLGSPKEDSCQLLIAHNPEYFDAYAKWGADLTLSGHVHGGIMRLPFVRGIVSPRLLRFPRYSCGEYSRLGKKMIVSCGLGMHTIKVRVFNPAELSVVDIVPQE